jgi:hypothetical protein
MSTNSQSSSKGSSKSSIAAVSTINEDELRGLIGECITPFNESVRDEQLGLLSVKQRKVVKSAQSTPPSVNRLWLELRQAVYQTIKLLAVFQRTEKRNKSPAEAKSQATMAFVSIPFGSEDSDFVQNLTRVRSTHGSDRVGLGPEIWIFLFKFFHKLQNFAWTVKLSCEFDYLGRGLKIL